MTEIVAVSHLYLSDPRIAPGLSMANSTDLKMLEFFCQLCQQAPAHQLGLMPRAGINNLPFTNKFINMIGATMPAYDPKFTASWSEVTDQRAIEIEKMAIADNKKLAVFWSGGIDSTCILAAILKNFHPTSLDLVTVVCTPDGILENPVFYENHVVPNFKIANTNDAELLLADDVIFLDGYAADTLLMSMSPSLDVCMAVRNGKLLSNSWRTSPDALIDYLSKVTGSKLFATWYYEINKQSIESTNVPIETYFDFMWWISFNYDYYTWVIHTWFYVLRQHNISWEDCQRKFVGWFRTTPYQLWAMNNNGAMVKHTDKLGSFKHHPKQYIYEYDRNEYYYRYKIKLISTGRAYKSVADKPFAITDQFEILYLEKDINQILELLPTHLT